VIEVLTTNICE